MNIEKGQYMENIEMIYPEDIVMVFHDLEHLAVSTQSAIEKWPRHRT